MSRHYCDPANPCPGCTARIDEAEWERGARDNDPEPYFAQPDDITGDWLDYQPDWHFPRGLAPIGWP